MDSGNDSELAAGVSSREEACPASAGRTSRGGEELVFQIGELVFQMVNYLAIIVRRIAGSERKVIDSREPPKIASSVRNGPVAGFVSFRERGT